MQHPTCRTQPDPAPPPDPHQLATAQLATAQYTRDRLRGWRLILAGSGLVGDFAQARAARLLVQRLENELRGADQEAQRDLDRGLLPRFGTQQLRQQAAVRGGELVAPEAQGGGQTVETWIGHGGSSVLEILR